MILIRLDIRLLLALPSSQMRIALKPRALNYMKGNRGNTKSFNMERVMGFEPTTPCLGSKHSTTELHPLRETIASKCSQEVFTNQLLNEFIISRSVGTNPKTITSYHYALYRFIGYPLTPEGINAYLNSLSCHQGPL